MIPGGEVTIPGPTCRVLYGRMGVVPGRDSVDKTFGLCQTLKNGTVKVGDLLYTHSAVARVCAHGFLFFLFFWLFNAWSFDTSTGINLELQKV